MGVGRNETTEGAIFSSSTFYRSFHLVFLNKINK